MKKINFKIFLFLIFILTTILFLIFSGEENVVIRLTIYLIGPITAVVSGIVAMKSFGWKGKSASIAMFILVGVWLWLLGEIATLYFVWKGVDTYPTIADFFFISGYIFYTLAVVFKIKLFGLLLKKINIKKLVILGILFLISALLSGYMALLGYDPEGGFLVNFVSFSWVLGDLVAGGLSLILLAMAWEYRGGLVRIGWVWFLGALIANLVADSVYSLNPKVIAEGSTLSILLDILWTAGYCMFAGYFLERYKGIKELKNKIPNMPKFEK